MSTRRIITSSPTLVIFADVIPDLSLKLRLDATHGQGTVARLGRTRRSSRHQDRRLVKR